MAQTIPNREPAGTVPAPYLDCERLDCYRVAVDFQVVAARMASGRSLGALRDQLDRASVSIVLDVAEVAGRRTPPARARCYAIARSSATECAAILDLLVARALGTPADHRHGRGLLIRIIQMLTRLIEHKADR